MSGFFTKTRVFKRLPLGFGNLLLFGMHVNGDGIVFIFNSSFDDDISFLVSIVMLKD
jgi:hypothetical protein